MMDMETIRSISSKAAKKAKREGTRPLVIKDQTTIDQLRVGTRTIPFIGDYVPEGFYLEDSLFVDTSGFGSESEPAMTQEMFFKRLTVGKAYAVIEAGEFQVYVGVFGVNGKEHKGPGCIAAC